MNGVFIRDTELEGSFVTIETELEVMYPKPNSTKDGQSVPETRMMQRRVVS